MKKMAAVYYLFPRFCSFFQPRGGFRNRWDHYSDSKGINTPSVKRQRQGPIGMHCDAPTQASKLQSAAAADARCGHPFSLPINYYVLKEMICQDEYKIIQLKL